MHPVDLVVRGSWYPATFALLGRVPTTQLPMHFQRDDIEPGAAGRGWLASPPLPLVVVALAIGFMPLCPSIQLAFTTSRFIVEFQCHSTMRCSTASPEGGDIRGAHHLLSYDALLFAPTPIVALCTWPSSCGPLLRQCIEGTRVSIGDGGCSEVRALPPIKQSD